MSENAIDSENVNKPAPDAAKPKGARKAKKGKPAKKAGRAKKATVKPKADRTNKKTEVIAMMKRAKGATLAEIMKATGWRPHTVRGFVQERRGRTDVQDREIASGNSSSKRRLGHVPGAAFLLLGASK